MTTLPFEDRLRSFIEEKALLPGGEPVLVGVSGGVDSVVLLHALYRLGYELRAAHVNYGLRGADSDRDEALVRSLCEARDIPLGCAAFDTHTEAEQAGRSVQETARDLRYAFMASIAERHGIRRVAVGHHLDDQAETVLLNLFRGSGPEGLAGMPPQRRLGEESAVLLIRPLLFARRAEAEAYARTEGLPWRTDVTNQDPKYRRGALRAEILPLIQRHFGAAVPEHIARTAGLLQEYLSESLIPELQRRFAEAGQEEEEGGRLALAPLRDEEPVWQRRLILEALRRWLPSAPRGYVVAERVVGLLEAQPGRRLPLGEGVVWRERDGLLFLPRAEPPGSSEGETLRLLQPGASIPLARGHLSLEPLGGRPAALDPGTPLQVFVDAERLSFPLQVRPWKAGDRLQPLGMEGTKNVSDLLTDARVPPSQRSGVWVVISEDEIVWVVGHRLAHPFRVCPESRQIAKITYHPGRAERS